MTFSNTNLHRVLFYAGLYSGKLIRSFFALAVCDIPCVSCGKPAGSISLCPECRRLLDSEAMSAISDERRCIKCGRPLLSEHGVCTTCRDKPVFQNIDGAFPLFAYVLSKKKLLYSWKIGRQHNLTEVFAGYIADVIKTRFPDAVVVPVPPRPGKLKKTGWDQIEDMARHLEYRFGMRVLRILRRTEAIQQKKLTKEERAEHSRKAYVLDERFFKRYPEYKQLTGKQTDVSVHAVLLDDVITTGSTISACAEVLKSSGFQKVSAVSLFIVPG